MKETNANLYAGSTVRPHRHARHVHEYSACLVNGLESQDATIISGSSVAMASIYSNGGVKISGTGNLYGSAAAIDKMELSGGQMIWYVEASDAISGGGGATSALPEGIRLLSYAEW